MPRVLLFLFVLIVSCFAQGQQQQQQQQKQKQFPPFAAVTIAATPTCPVCSPGLFCCNAICVAGTVTTHKCCETDNTAYSCLVTENCCGFTCCPVGQECCGNGASQFCCGAGQACVGGICLVQPLAAATAVTPAVPSFPPFAAVTALSAVQGKQKAA